MPPSFTCDLSSLPSDFPHFWEHTIGSGHATLTLRADWQQQMTRAHNEIGCRYVRFHGILSDDMGTLINQNNQPLYSFHNTDKIFDFLVSIGMRPFVELSFMPLMLSSGDDIVFHYRGNITPPRDQSQWNTLISKLVQHWVDRYGAEEVRQWFFEVWNEPNLKAFWTGSQQDYFKFYAETARTIKAVDENLQVGGPATAANEWISDFIAYCDANKVPNNFISTHHYPTDAFGKPGDDTETQLSVSRRSVLRDQAREVRKQAGTRPVYYTEWSTSSNPRDALHDDPYAAAYIIKTIMEQDGLVQSYSYWTFSDIFEENYFPSVPFHGGFGLLNIHNIAKPAYRAYELLHLLGEKRFAVTGEHATVDAWVASGNGIQILLDNSALPRNPISDETVTVTLANAKISGKARMCRIDAEHANAKALWQKMGAPEYPTPAEVTQLDAASRLIWQDQPIEKDGNSVKLAVTMTPQSVVMIILE